MMADDPIARFRRLTWFKTAKLDDVVMAFVEDGSLRDAIVAELEAALRASPPPDDGIATLANISDTVAAYCSRNGDEGFTGLALDAAVRKMFEESEEAYSGIVSNFVAASERVKELEDELRAVRYGRREEPAK